MRFGWRTSTRLLLAIVCLTFALPVHAQADGKSIFDDDDTDAPPPPPKAEPPPPPLRLTPRPEAPVPPQQPPKPEPAPETPVPPKPDEPPPPPPAPAIPPVPDAAALAPAEKRIRDAFATEYAKTALLDKSALARALLREVSGNLSDPPTLYVLLRDARDLAAAAGDAEAAAVAAHNLRESFALDAVTAKSAERNAVIAAAKSAAEAPAPANLPPSFMRRAAELVMNAAEQERAAGQYALAAQVAQGAVMPAKRSGDASFAARVAARAAMLQALAAEAEPVRSALATLKTSPDDPKANQTAGSFYALLLDRFDLGLPKLAKSADPALKAAATKDAAAGDDANGLAAAADAWAVAAAPMVAGSPQRDAAQRRALLLYDRAASTMSGLEAAAVRKRALDLRVSRLRKGGLIGAYYIGREFESSGAAVVTRLDPAIEFNWTTDRADPAMPLTEYSVRWSGFIKASAGEYKLFAVHDDTFKLTIDDEIIFRGGSPARPNKKVKLSGTYQPIVIEYRQFGGNAKVGLGWQPPSGIKPRAVPAEMLYSEPPVATAIAVAPLADLTAPVTVLAAAGGGEEAVPLAMQSIRLTAAQADLHGDGLTRDGERRVRTWTKASQWVSWDVTVPSGEYEVFLKYGVRKGVAGAAVQAVVGPNRLNYTIGETGGWDNFKRVSLGKATIPTAGRYMIQIRPQSVPKDSVMVLVEVELRPVQ